MKAILGITAALAATAALNYGLGKRAESRNPAQGTFIDLEGIRLHYLEAGQGSGPPIVLLHGNNMTVDDWADSGLLGRLAETSRVVAIERPGYGYSDRPRSQKWTPERQADVIVEAFEALRLERPIVLGHSFGATTAAALALDYPTELSGLVLLAGYYYPTKRLDAALAVPGSLPLIGDLLSWTEAPLLGRALMPMALKAMFAPLPVPQQFSEKFRRELVLRPWQLRAMSEDGATMVAAAQAMEHRYRTITVPVAIVAGDADKVVEPEQSRRLHSELPSSTFRIIAGMGHVLHWQGRDAVLAIVDAIRDEVEASK